MPVFPPNWTPWLDAAEKVFRIAGYIAGGAWAYFKFFRGRTFRPRLEPSIVAHFHRHAPRLLTAAVKVKNVGLSRVDVLQEGTGVRVYRLAEGLRWDRFRTLEVLKGHGWIEPGETIEEHVLAEVPGDEPSALKIQLTLQSRKTQWEVDSIVVCQEVPMVDLVKQINPDAERIRQIEQEKRDQAQIDRNRERVDEIEREKTQPPAPPPDKPE